MNIDSSIYIILIFLFYFFLLKKFPLLNDDISSSNHKKLVGGKLIPILLGGPYLITIILIYAPNNFYPIKLIFCLIVILGLMSDKNFLPNPKLRLIIQILLLVLIVYNQELKIEDLRSGPLNFLLSNDIFNICFTVFCLAILINGCNFIDGLNGLLVGYLIFSLISIFYITSTNTNLNLIDREFLNIFWVSLVIFFIFNIFGLVYLGDSGSYIISVVIGFYLIQISSINNSLSPYYIALILWYPAFENLFSLMRRIIKQKKVSGADNHHLHQLFYLYLKNRNFFNKKYLNSFCSIIILMYNLPGFLISCLFPSKTNILVSVILLNLITYLLFYNFFIKQLKNEK